MPAPTPTPKPSLLVIDDEPHILELMRAGLSGEFDIETATSADDAALLTATHRYDVIICDQIMPGQNGLEFLMRSAQLQPETRRIMMTGYINPELLSRAVSLARLSACVLKPAPVDELKRVIREALAKK